MNSIKIYLVSIIIDIIKSRILKYQTFSNITITETIIENISYNFICQSVFTIIILKNGLFNFF